MYGPDQRPSRSLFLSFLLQFHFPGSLCPFCPLQRILQISSEHPQNNCEQLYTLRDESASAKFSTESTRPKSYESWRKKEVSIARPEVYPKDPELPRPLKNQVHNQVRRLPHQSLNSELKNTTLAVFELML